VEKLLQQIAKQLQSIDEASLMSLWGKYQERVKLFEPTKAWEEAVIILCMIQAVRWKNQLFNAKWAEQQTTSLSPLKNSPAPFQESQDAREPVQGCQAKKGKILPFRSEEDTET
jgi:hypothetical protein